MNPASYAILRAHGPDRPGQLLALARFIAEHGGNIIRDVEEAFGPEAELLLHMEVTDVDRLKMEAGLPALLEATGLSATLVPAGGPALRGFQVGSLLAIADDFPGLLARIAAFLSSHGIEVISHQGTRLVTRDAATGEPRARYVQYFTLRRPSTCELLAFEDELRAVKHAWGVFLLYREDEPFNPSVFADLQALGDFPAGT